MLLKTLRFGTDVKPLPEKCVEFTNEGGCNYVALAGWRRQNFFLSAHRLNRQLVRKMMFVSFANHGVTIGTVNMVLTTAIINNAVNVSLVMMFLSSRILAKMIMINTYQHHH